MVQVDNLQASLLEQMEPVVVFLKMLGEGIVFID